jgi:hypothetical protein
MLTIQSTLRINGHRELTPGIYYDMIHALALQDDIDNSAASGIWDLVLSELLS